MKPIHPSSRARSKRGIALAAAISMLSILGVLLISLLGGSVEKKKFTDERQSDSRVESVADTAIALAANRIWSSFDVAFGPDNLQPWNFRTHMDNLGVPDQAGTANPVPTDFMANMNLAQDVDGNFPLSGAYVLGVTILREDDWDSSRITVSARASLQPNNTLGEHNNKSDVQQVFEITRPDWDGKDFALLANNVNCILCHAEIDDAERFYNQDPSARGNFARVRVGSLESIHIRENPDSTIAGALYLGGSALEDDGDPITDWASLSLKSADFNLQTFLTEDAFGGLTFEDLSPWDPMAPAPGENLYLDYLAGGPDAQIDGALPDYFPSPFPDNGGFDQVTGLATPEFADNRILDANEFQATAGAATGSISGGRVAVMPTGSSMSTLAQVDTALDGGPGSLASQTAGNVILHGTELNPIILDGSVAIDGDVVLSGYVKGKGAITASGNVFIPGELKLLDGDDSGNRTFGTSSDGVTNALAVTAGGNITVGDPTHTPSGGGGPVDGTPAAPFNFIMDELAIFNRGEWIKTQPQLPGETVYQKTGEVTNPVWRQPTKDVPSSEDVDVYEWQDTGNMIPEDVYGWVVTGQHVVDEYTTINHPADPPEPYGSPWTEKIWTGSHLEDTKEWKVTGSTMVPEQVYVYVRTDTVPTVDTVPDGPGYFEDVTTDVMEWVTPMHPNPFYEGVAYIPRYYAFDDGSPVPIFNNDGYFNPVAEIWHSEERAENWTNGRLSLADPANPVDPFLYNADGTPKAVVQKVMPSADWLTNGLLADLVDQELSGRTASDPVQVDATLYSANSIFGMVPARDQAGVEGKMLINGGLIAADIGVLAPKGIQVNYDLRSRELLDIADDRKLVMRRSLWAPIPRL